jgi:molecular chaperone GrpE
MTADSKKAGREDSGAGREGYGTEAVSAAESTSPTSVPSPSPGSPSTDDQREKVERDIGELLVDVERERDEYLELARRTKADFENYRKRVAGEAAQAAKRGRVELVRQLLPVLDNLERALAAAEPVDRESVPNHLAEGVRLVYEELKAILERSGIESYEPSGERFDPEWHEAMMTRPATRDEAGKVLEVLEKGYRLDGQVLRPARVVVGEAESQQCHPTPEGSGGTPPDG